MIFIIINVLFCARNTEMYSSPRQSPNDDEQVIAESAVILEYLQQIKISNLNLSNLRIYSNIYALCWRFTYAFIGHDFSYVNKHVPWLIQPVAKKITEKQVLFVHVWKIILVF